MKYFLALLMLVALSINSSSAQSVASEKVISTYPYYASKERVAQIKDSYAKIRIGMVPEQVKELLGEPDEIHPLHEPIINNPRQIGTTHWFIIQRVTDNGSQIGRDEKLVRISYDLNWMVTRVDKWGFDEQTRKAEALHVGRQ